MWLRLLRWTVMGAALVVATESALTRHYYGRTYNYYDAAEVYWEDQNTFLLYLPHRLLFWSLKPGVRIHVAEKATNYGLLPEHNHRERHEWDIRVGPKGFRGEDFPAQKPDGEMRVVCFGDSRTLGEGLGESATYPARLESLLQGSIRNRRVRVINLGADGWSSHQGLTLLRTQAVGYSPDFAVFAFGINDTDSEWGLSDRAKAGLLDSALVTAQRAVYRSMTFYWTQKQFLAAKGWLKGKTRMPTVRRPAGRVPRVSAEEYAENVSRFVQVCRENGIVPIVLVIPANPYRGWDDGLDRPGDEQRLAQATQGRSREEAIAALEGLLREDPAFDTGRHSLASLYREAGELGRADEQFSALAARSVFARYGEAARAAATAEDAPLVDVSRAFRDRRQEPLYIDAVHPSRLGAGVVADSLLQAIQTQIVRAPHLAPPAAMASLDLPAGR